MKERPILFSTPMVQAILDGRKTMTRRVVAERNSSCTSKLSELDFNNVVHEKPKDLNYQYLKVYRPSDETRHRVWPNYEPGDRLWVREKFLWQDSPFRGFKYAAEYSEALQETQKWKPSIHMPKSACRIFLEVVSVKVERLNEISQQDALAEGVKHVIDKVTGYCGWDYLHGGYNLMTTPFLGFKSLWSKINGVDSWNENPWVWVIEFKRIENTPSPTSEGK